MKEKVEQLIARLKQRQETFGLAESCTGGWLASQCTMLPGVSSVFQGSVVCYANSVKTELLQVPASAIAVYGAVSEPVARHMARGARKRLNCDWSLSITGIAGPGGGSPEKPIGTVCYGISGPGIEYTLKKQMSETQRHAIQQASAVFALDLLLSELK